MDRPSKGTFRMAGREFPQVTWYKVCNTWGRHMI